MRTYERDAQPVFLGCRVLQRPFEIGCRPRPISDAQGFTAIADRSKSVGEIRLKPFYQKCTQRSKLMSKVEERLGVSRDFPRPRRHHFQTAISRAERLLIGSKNFSIGLEYLGAHEIKKTSASIAGTSNQIDIGIGKINDSRHVDVRSGFFLFDRIQSHLSPAGAIVVLEMITGDITVGDKALCAKAYQLSHGIGSR